MRVFCTVETLHRDPISGYRIGKKGVMENKDLRHHFRALYTKYAGLHRTQSTKAADVVFDKLVEKAINARSAITFRKI